MVPLCLKVRGTSSAAGTLQRDSSWFGAESFPFNKLCSLVLRLFSGCDSSGNPGSHSPSHRNLVFILLSEMLE